MKMCSLFLGVWSSLLLSCQFDATNVALSNKDAGTFTTNNPDASSVLPDAEIVINMDAGNAKPSLTDDGVIVRYRINEEGIRPFLLQDSIDNSSTSLANLLVVYDDDNDGSVTINEHHGIEFTDKNDASQAFMQLLFNHKLRIALQDSQTVTLEIVLDIDNSNSGTRLLHIGKRDGGSECTILLGSGNRPQFLMNGQEVGAWEVDLEDQSPGRIVLHWVINTALENSEDRVQLYLNGDIQSKRESSQNPDRNEQIDFDDFSDYSFVLGNRRDGQRGLAGKIYYAAVYSGALPTSQVIQNYNILIDNDD